MDERNKQLLRLALVVTVAMGGFFLVTEFLLDEPERSAEEALPPPEDQSDSAEGDSTTAVEGADPAQEEPSPSRVEPAQRLETQQLFTIETDRYRAELTNLNTGLVKFVVKDEQYATRGENGAPHQMVTTDLEGYFPFQPEFGGIQVPADAVWTGEQLSDQAVRFTWSGAGFRIVRKLEAGRDPYQLWSTVRITNLGSRARPVRLRIKTYHYVRRSEEGGGFPFARPSPAAGSAICHYDDSTVRIDRSTLEEDGAQGYGPRVAFAGVETNYFALVMAADEETAERCRLSSTVFWAGGEEYASLFESQLIYPRKELGGREDVVYRTLGFVGPKDLGAIEAAGHQLREVVDLGWFDVISESMVKLLGWIYGVIGGDETGNWGLAIILLTVLVKIVLYPLTEKSFRSMARMRMLKPEMDRINELYPDDREKKTAATMELYRREKINPLGGCLPMLLQMPIWFALYQSLSTNVELYHADFGLWLHDLSAPDPYYVLPLLLGVLMFVQQKFSPTTPDATQAKMMMYIMPVMMTLFMLLMPAGLCLYIVTNSILGIGQQQLTHYRLERSHRKAASQPTAEPSSDSSESPADEADALASSRRPKGKAISASSKKSRSKRRKTRGRA